MSPCASKVTAVKGPTLNGQFLPLEPGFWAELEAFLRQHPHSLSGYTLRGLAAWNELFDYHWAFPEEKTLLVSYRSAPEGVRHLLQPVGDFTPPAQEKVLHYAAELPYPLRIMGADRGFVQSHPGFAAHFTVQEDRNNHNYIYLASDLAGLAGRRYAKKRNLLSQAGREYAWTGEPLTAANIEVCAQVLAECRRDMGDQTDPALAQDDLAIQAVIRQFPDLPHSGILIRVEGEGAAFSLFEPQTPDTAVVHFERARRRYKGLYQVLNQAEARAIAESGFTYINREEDLGDPGLRQSKESYFPDHMAEAFVLTYKG